MASLASVRDDARMSGHVYVSYSPSDSAYVQQLVLHLTAAGLTVRLVPPGNAAELIAESIAVVPILTPRSAASEDVRAEVEAAKAGFKPVLPLRLEEGEPPAALAGLPTEDVTGGAMPSQTFVDHLRRLAGAEPVASGTAPPRLVDAVPPAPPKKRSRKAVVWITVGIVGLLLICGLGGALLVGVANLRSNSVANASVGECLGGTTSTELDADKMTKVDCGSAEAKFKVVGRIEDKTSAEREASCEGVAETDFVFWTGREGGKGTVLCLQEAP
jgi:hypothetical protein